MVSTVTFKAGGRTHKLRLSARAACQIEDAVGLSLPEWLSTLEDRKFGYNTCRILFEACLADGGGVDSGVALFAIDELGGLVPAGELIGDLLAKSFPAPESDGAGAKDQPTGNAKAA